MTPQAAPSTTTRERLVNALITTDPHQRIRLAMTGLAALLMLCCIVTMYMVAWAGPTPVVPVYWWSLACCAGLVLAYGLIRSGYSLRWRDPSLTLAQILYSIACNAVAYMIAGPARGIALPILAVIMMFGIFGLTPRQMVGVLVYGLAVFGGATAATQWWLPQEPQHPALTATYLIMIAVVLLSSTFLTLRVQASRRLLRRQKAELAQALEQIRQLATHDDLTGLPNRRYMQELMRLERRRAQRTPQPPLLAVLDLDHFKQVNDTYGHTAGDLALQAFARTVTGCVRATDVLARWGGEEFVLLMSGTAPQEGAGLLERVRHAVASTPVPLQDGTALTLTVSIGAAPLQGSEPSESWVQRADAAVYAAKRLGRNRVVWAPDDAPEKRAAGA